MSSRRPCSAVPSFAIMMFLIGTKIAVQLGSPSCNANFASEAYASTSWIRIDLLERSLKKSRKVQARCSVQAFFCSGCGNWERAYSSSSAYRAGTEVTRMAWGPAFTIVRTGRSATTKYIGSSFPSNFLPHPRSPAACSSSLLNRCAFRCMITMERTSAVSGGGACANRFLNIFASFMRLSSSRAVPLPLCGRPN